MAPNHRKVVARYADGRLVKGYTFDFGPSQPRFHVFSEPSASGPSSAGILPGRMAKNSTPERPPRDTTWRSASGTAR
jgi:hypothetical protein